jgi:hypothetical protein
MMGLSHANVLASAPGVAQEHQLEGEAVTVTLFLQHFPGL